MTTFSYHKALNVFTDASITKYTDNGWITCAGYIVVKDGIIIDSGKEIIHNATSCYGEIYAIKMAIETISKYSNTPINLFSDSQISILGLKSRIYNWYQNQVNRTLMTNTKEPVSSQEVYLDIMRMIIQYNIQISLYHIPSHIRLNNVKDMSRFKELFYANDESLREVDNRTIEEIINCNNIIDNMTRDYLVKITRCKDYDPDRYMKYSIIPLIWFPKPQDLQAYSQLVS